MRISHRHRFIFFSFPKTGSESVRDALNDLSDIRGGRWPRPDRPFLAHMRPVEVRQLFQERGWPFEEYYRFVFVRNPWLRLLSLYEMIVRDEKGAFRQGFGDWLLASRTDGDGGGNENALTEGRLHRRYGTYTIDNFVRDENGHRLVNDIFRLEDMPSVPDRLRARGIPLSLDIMPWVNRTKARRDVAAAYTFALRTVVAARYAGEIDEFGYTFPG